MVSMPTFASLLLALFLCLLTWQGWSAYYRLYLHPLHNIAGPKLWIVFPLLRHIVAIRGDLDVCLIGFHRRYGNVVRFSTDELSFTGPDARLDIYASHPVLEKALPKRKDIVSAETTRNARLRKALTRAFSDKAIHDQEPILRTYAELLVQKLTEAASTARPQDIVKWLNIALFDVIGELTINESFNGLASNTLHEWIVHVINGTRIVPYVSIAMSYPIAKKLLRILMAIRKDSKYNEHPKLRREAIVKRMRGSPAMRGHFLDAMLQGQDLEEDEIAGTMNALFLAGSETMATTLSGLIYYLLMNPSSYEMASNEVRTAFGSAQAISFSSTKERLPYLNACLNETMRLYPPVATGIQRVTPPSDSGRYTTIGQTHVPPRTKVFYHSAAAFSDPEYFYDSQEFRPERWFSKDGKSPNQLAMVQPFGVGPRNCIGRSLAYAEMRLIISMILFHFDLSIPEQYEQYWKTWRDQKVYIIWQKKPLWCYLSRRDCK